MNGTFGLTGPALLEVSQSAYDEIMEEVQTSNLLQFCETRTLSDGRPVLLMTGLAIVAPDVSLPQPPTFVSRAQTLGSAFGSLLFYVLLLLLVSGCLGAFVYLNLWIWGKVL